MTTRAYDSKVGTGSPRWSPWIPAGLGEIWARGIHPACSGIVEYLGREDVLSTEENVSEWLGCGDDRHLRKEGEE